MGQVQSSGLPSREEILARTKNGRDIVSQVFDWMISRTSLRELYSLANPEQCKKYIFLTADALDVLFKKIELEPQEGKKGLIYFQKVEELTRTPTGDDVRGRQRQIICLKLAFLYVRIFQIFASLALSVLDVDPRTEIRFYDELGRLQEENLPLFGQRKPFQGGALSSSKFLPPGWNFLRSILNEVENRPSYYRIGSLGIFLDINTIDADQTVKIIYQYKGPRKNRPSEAEVKTIVGRIGFEMKSSGEEFIAQANLINLVDNQGRRIDDATIRFSQRFIGDIYRDGRGRSIPDSLENFFKKILAGEGDREEGAVAPGKTLSRDDTGVAAGLHTKTLLEAFRQTMPVKAHCVARALQLLSESGLQSAVPSEIYSSVCKAKFLSENRSLPETDREVTRSYGIYALAQLFYDTMRDVTPIIGEATRDQYNAFLLKMKFVFEEAKNAKGVSTLADIKSRAPSSLCGPETKEKLLKVTNRDVIRQIRVVGSRMINYQVTHTANVVNVLKKLFLLPIESGKPLQIHPNVRKNGMIEVNKIAAEARELLVSYYSQCEIMYRQGAEILAENKSAIKIV
jgi:hypothetical protein